MIDSFGDQNNKKIFSDIFRHYLVKIKNNDEIIAELQMIEVSKYVARKISDLNRKKKDYNKTGIKEVGKGEPE